MQSSYVPKREKEIGFDAQIAISLLLKVLNNYCDKLCDDISEWVNYGFLLLRTFEYSKRVT